MNKFLLALSALFTLVFASCCLAAAEYPGNCPTVASIQQGSFATIAKTDNGGYGAVKIGQFNTSITWYFGLLLPSASDITDAENKAKTLTNSLTSVMGPHYFPEKDMWGCAYLDANSQVIAVAFPSTQTSMALFSLMNNQ